MSYFVTGATGFIGRFLVSNLLKREGHDLCAGAQGLAEEARRDREEDGLGHEAASSPVVGDMTAAKCGVSAAQVRTLTGKVKHFFHLAAIYDLTASAESQRAANVDGTQHALDLAAAIQAGCFHHTSSIAAAGLYQGVFREDMFDEAEGLDDPYLRTKHDSEGLVRNEKRMPWRIYRPGMVVGHSQTGEIDKIDGPYYFFTLLKKLREMLPPWMPTLGIEGGRINIVPVDFVVDAMDHIAHKPKLDGHTFHLTDPEPMRVGEVLNTFARAGHAPEMTMRIDARMFALRARAASAARSATCRRCGASSACCCATSGSRRTVLKFINYPTRFDKREAERALKGSGIAVPKLDGYAWRLWDYWERHLDPDLFIDRTLQGQGPQQGRRHHRRLVGHRPVDRAARRRGRRDHRHRRARRGGAVQGARRDEEGRRQGLRLHRRPRRHGRLRPAGRDGAQGARPRRRPDQQRRTLDPALDRAQLRPLPRFRAHHAAQLLRQPAPDHGLHADDDAPAQGPHHQHQLDRRAGQLAALLGLRRVEGGAGRVQPLRAGRVRRARASASPRSTCRW